MAEYYWPASLPQSPLRANYAHGGANDAIRTEMEFGSAKIRRRSSANMRSLSLTYALDESKQYSGEEVNQKSIFLKFFEVVGCAASFWLPDPENSKRYIKVRIRPSGEGTSFEIRPLAHKVWSLPLQLEVWPYAAKPRL